MSDRREQILERLQTILVTVPNIVSVWRDRGVLPPAKCPAILLLDGDESRQTRVEGKQHVQMPPAVFTFRPEIAIVLPPRDTVQNLTLGGMPAAVGPALSSFRAAILAAVLNDIEIVTLCIPSGQITYDGYTTDMRVGQEIGAQGPFMLFRFSLGYTLDPANLLSP